MEIRDGEVFVSEDFHLPYTTQHIQHQGMLLLFSLMHTGTSVTKPEGLQSLCLLKWQILSHPTRTSTLSLISNYFQSLRQNAIVFLYQKMRMSQLSSGQKHAFPTPSPMTKTPDRNRSLQPGARKKEKSPQWMLSVQRTLTQPSLCWQPLHKHISLWGDSLPCCSFSQHSLKDFRKVWLEAEDTLQKYKNLDKQHP